MHPFDEILAYVRDTYDPDGVVVAGSRLRGEAGPTSDHDVVVIHRCAWRLRDQRRFAGVPTEIFVNPPAAVRRSFEREHADGRPCTAHMLATGQPLGRSAPVVDELIAEARAWLARPPPPIDVLAAKYQVVDLLDDARDVHGADPAAELQLLVAATSRIAEYAFRSRRRFLPRRKAMVRELAALDPEAGALLAALAVAAPEERLPLVERLARRVIGVDTFFTWRSAPEPVDPS